MSEATSSTDTATASYEELLARVARLEAALAAVQGGAPTAPVAEAPASHQLVAQTESAAPPPTAAPAAAPPGDPASDERGWSRRALLLGGAAAAASGAAALTGATPAAAATGTMTFGAINDAGTSTTTLNTATGSAGSALVARNTGFGAGLNAFATLGDGVGDFPPAVGATATGRAWGVRASAQNGYGVHATSSQGAPLRLDCPNRLSLPSSASSGDFIAFLGQLWFCVQGGTPARWRLLAATSSAGAFIPITPVRVYDSRLNTAVDAPPGPLASGGSRLISVAEAFQPGSATSAGTAVPVGARAVAVNLTATDTTNSGFMFLAPGTATQISASSLNWTGARVTICNAFVVAVDTALRLKAFVECSGGSGSTQFLVDVSGYYLGA